jgi:hypothetical protein
VKCLGVQDEEPRRRNRRNRRSTRDSAQERDLAEDAAGAFRRHAPAFLRDLHLAGRDRVEHVPSLTLTNQVDPGGYSHDLRVAREQIEALLRKPGEQRYAP